MVRMTSAAAASAGTVLVAGTITFWLYDFGAHSRHMALHIVSMNVAAPLLAAGLVVQWRRPIATPPAALWVATVVQIVLLWAWHAPAVYDFAMKSHAAQFAMHGLLFAAAMAFWLALLTIGPSSRWQTLPALLLTGKLACLLAALLIFAPRTLYDAAGHLAHAVDRLSGLSHLDDQHLAGVLMITACPLSYLVAAVMIAVQLVRPEAQDPLAAPQSLSLRR
jgi:putative membrane protein